MRRPRWSTAPARPGPTRRDGTKQAQQRGSVRARVFHCGEERAGFIGVLEADVLGEDDRRRAQQAVPVDTQVLTRRDAGEMVERLGQQHFLAGDPADAADQAALAGSGVAAHDVEPGQLHPGLGQGLQVGGDAVAGGEGDEQADERLLGRLDDPGLQGVARPDRECCRSCGAPGRLGLISCTNSRLRARNVNGRFRNAW
jgi:hypothetical protein